MSLKARLTEDMKTAMKAGETDRLAVIRLVNSAIKQRRDSVSQFEAAGREDLAAVERAEIAVIQTYMPAPLSEAEVEAAVLASIAESGAAGPQDMGKVMAVLKPRIAGRADMGALSGLVKKKLAGG